MKNHPVTQTEYFKMVKQLVDTLHTTGIIETGSGYCLSMSDIMLKILHKNGIKSKLVECSLMVINKNPPGMYLMGYPGFNQNNYSPEKMMQTHVVCVTETETPILIDLSVSHIDPNIPYICAPIMQNFEHTNLAEYDFETSTWTYTEKTDTEIELPKLHQNSILDRIKKDNHIEKQIKFIKGFLFVMFAVSFLNFVRGGYDFYQTYVNPHSGWGPPSKSIKHNHFKN